MRRQPVAAIAASARREQRAADAAAGSSRRYIEPLHLVVLERAEAREFALAGSCDDEGLPAIGHRRDIAFRHESGRPALDLGEAVVFRAEYEDRRAMQLQDRFGIRVCGRTDD